jgi:hypothetical protein
MQINFKQLSSRLLLDNTTTITTENQKIKKRKIT